MERPNDFIIWEFTIQVWKETMTWKLLEGGSGDYIRTVKAKMTTMSQQLLRKSQPFDHNYTAETNVYEVAV